MTRLEDLQPTAAVRGILPDQVVTVVSVQWFGSEALELTYKGPSGRVANELLNRHDEPRLQVVEHGRPRSFDGDGHLFRLVSEAHRIRLAHLCAPVLPAGLVGSSVRVTLEIEAEIPQGAPDNVVRTVTENSRTLKFTSNSGFETE